MFAKVVDETVSLNELSSIAKCDKRIFVGIVCMGNPQQP
jgi:hypothetical protein